MRTWRFSLATRIGLSVVAAFMFSIAGLLFDLPFMVGNGDLSGDWIVFLTAVVMVGFAVFTTFALIVALRTRVTLSATTFEATVVSGYNALLVPRLREVRLPLSHIRSVERRREVFRSFGFSTMREALSIVTVAGKRIGLFSNTLGTLSTLPIDEVADAIATAAAITVTDDGTVRAQGSGLYGAASSSWTELPLDAPSAAKAQRAALLTAQICTGLLLLTFILRAIL